MNLKTIADGLATRFVNVTATVGSETEMATATADLPNQIAKLALLVYPPETGTLDIGVSGRRNDLYTFAVRLLRDPLDVPTRSRWLYAWYDAIHDKVITTGVQLGITPPPQVYAEAVGMSAAIDGFRYAPMVGRLAPFDVVELTVAVRVNEHVSGITT